MTPVHGDLILYRGQKWLALYTKDDSLLQYTGPGVYLFSGPWYGENSEEVSTETFGKMLPCSPNSSLQGAVLLKTFYDKVPSVGEIRKEFDAT